MEVKLSKSRHRGDRNGWLKADALSLYNRLDQESSELYAALRDENATFEQIANEAADVANFAMMVADVVLTRKSVNRVLCLKNSIPPSRVLPQGPGRPWHAPGQKWKSQGQRGFGLDTLSHAVILKCICGDEQ
jgi:hypothetical protein